MSAHTIAPSIELALHAGGIALLPPFAVDTRIADRSLVPLLASYVFQSGEWAALWPTNRQLSPRIRALVDFMAHWLNLGD